NDDDTISICSRKAGTPLRRGSFRRTRSKIWRPFIGKPFGWGWITVNQQRYCDGALLGFQDIAPAIFLEVVASSIEVSRIVSEGEIKTAAGDRPPLSRPIRQSRSSAESSPVGRRASRTTTCADSAATSSVAPRLRE